MEQGNFFQEAALPLIAAAALIFFGIRARFFHNLSYIRGRNAAPLKDEKAYCEAAGNLMFLLAGISVVLAVVAYFISEIAGFVIMVAGLVLFFALWVRMNRKYGE